MKWLLMCILLAIPACNNTYPESKELCRAACTKLDRCDMCDKVGMPKWFCPTVEACAEKCASPLIQNPFLRGVPQCVLGMPSCRRDDLVQCVPEMVRNEIPKRKE